MDTVIFEFLFWKCVHVNFGEEIRRGGLIYNNRPVPALEV